jgi:aryl-alcohol dehydrogenase-like predicted oxidoreductase
MEPATSAPARCTESTAKSSPERSSISDPCGRVEPLTRAKVACCIISPRTPGFLSLGSAAFLKEVVLRSPINVQLGLGLISIGKEWGQIKSAVPEEKEALQFLEFAYQAGFTFFDTAPSYATSEARLGKFLKTLTPEERQKITIASKFGDHWNNQAGTAYVDHSYDALCASLDKTLSLLGKLDLLQLHKTTPEVLRSIAFRKALEYAQNLGITTFGASISDEESGLMVCEAESLSAIQLPYNASNTSFEKVIDRAIERNKFVLINRPYNMGALLQLGHETGNEQKQVAAYRLILQKNFRGIILTGTKSRQHLSENLRAFNAAISG